MRCSMSNSRGLRAIFDALMQALTNSDDFMRTSLDSHAPAGVLERARPHYVAVQNWEGMSEGSHGPNSWRRPMTAATFHTPTVLPERRGEHKPGFWARLFDAMAEARIRQAVRELARHRDLVPEDLSGNTATPRR